MNATPSLQKQYSIEEIPFLVGEVLLPLTARYSIFTFEGPLGAGKTTLIRSFLQKLGVREVITSPTFTYVNTYATDEKTIYHFDLYRLHEVGEFIEMGFDEFLADKNAYSFVEWPHVIESLLAKKEYKNCTAKIILKYDEKSLDQRVFELYT